MSIRIALEAAAQRGRGVRVEDLHGPDLGGAGHGAAWEGGPEAVCDGCIRTLETPHCAHQLVHGGIALQLHQAWHMHAAHLRQARIVIPLSAGIFLVCFMECGHENAASWVK